MLKSDRFKTHSRKKLQRRIREGEQIKCSQWSFSDLKQNYSSEPIHLLGNHMTNSPISFQEQQSKWCLGKAVSWLPFNIIITALRKYVKRRNKWEQTQLEPLLSTYPKQTFLVGKCRSSTEVVIKLPRLQREEGHREGRKKHKQATIIILVIFCKSF